MLELREYQRRSLDSLAEYFKAAAKHNARQAFIMATDRPYRDVPHMQGMPYVCLRVPTGGGKTLMACHALGIAAREYLHAERAVCLWLVPSNTIREQTLAALRSREHPYRKALEARFAGGVQVMDLGEALYMQRGTLDGETAVIVSTLAALRVEDTEGRKVYESNGSLQHHFDGIHPKLQEAMEREGGGRLIYSLANVLMMRRPVVIMDEAHNARTTLSFDTLARFKPSCIMEFTATPETTHKPEQGYFASNILHHVSALELKEAQMIKLPVKLRTRGDWKEVVAEALQKQRELEQAALAEEQATGEYIRPIVLFQAQSKSGNLTVEVLKQTLREDFQIPQEQIAVATGQTREIDDVNLFERECRIRFIITVQALREGWDCSFAYVLCSVAEQHSARAVEQILGRVLRMPRARRKQREELNCAYAFAASPNFVATAQSLRDAMVENGFQKMEANELVVAQEENGRLWEAEGGGTLFASATEKVSEQPNLAQLETGLRERVEFDRETGSLTVRGVVTSEEMEKLRSCFKNTSDKAAVERIYHRTQGRTMSMGSDDKEPLSVPLLGIRIDGELLPFDESCFLEVPWDLADCDAELGEAEFTLQASGGARGMLDVTEAGKVEMTSFEQQLQQDTSVYGAEPGWTAATLANWLDRQIPHPDITLAQSSLFILRVITGLMDKRGMTLEQVARAKYRLRGAIEEMIDRHRMNHSREVYQRLLFGGDAGMVEVSADLALVFEEDRYSPNWFYEGSQGPVNKHYFRLVGELKTEGEEFECAAFLNSLPQVKNWIRNLERRSESSFWLQTATDRFYPDFVAKLTDGRLLVVESKGEHLWSNDDSKEKRMVGELWAARSGGKCLFVMPKGKDWQGILDVISK